MTAAVLRDIFRQRWQTKFEELKQFFFAHGHSRPTREQAGDPLYAWLSTQRMMWRKGLLGPDRVRLLNGLEFVWYCGGQRYCWRELYAQLEAYYQYHGHSRVPYKLYKERDPEYGYLAMWVHCLRVQRRVGSLNQQKIEALEYLEFDWGTAGTGHMPWRTMFLRLQSFQARYGHCNVQRQDDERLYHWCLNQRACYHGQRPGCRLSDTQIRLLEGIGFPWQRKISWDEGLRLLAVFAQQHGHGLVPTVYPPEPRLAVFAMAQRVQYRKNRLTDAQIEALERYGLSLTEGKPVWRDGVRRYRQFIQQYGIYMVPTTYTKDPLLVKWFRLAMKNLKAGTLSALHRAELQALGHPLRA